MQVASSTFLVTGGASGLGAGTARMAASAGARVVIADMNEGEGEALARELGSEARFVRTDVTEEAQVQAAMAMALSAFGRLDVLVNCAGIVIGERVAGREG